MLAHPDRLQKRLTLLPMVWAHQARTLRGRHRLVRVVVSRKHAPIQRIANLFRMVMG